MIMMMNDLENKKMGEPRRQKLTTKPDMGIKQKQGKASTGNKTERRRNGKIFSVWHICGLAGTNI